jgi:hypothetical protein
MPRQAPKLKSRNSIERRNAAEAHPAIKPTLRRRGATLAIIGFSWGGWVTGSKANESARQQVQSAFVEALMPPCGDKFNRASNRVHGCWN